MKLKIPAGHADRQGCKIGGKGAPKLKGGGRGDLKVKVKVVTPEALERGAEDGARDVLGGSSEDLRAHIG